MGNSLTRANDLPTVFKRFAAESPLHPEIDVRSITPDGALFYDHWKRGQAVAILREQHPNFLILQGQSTEPLFATQNFNYYVGMSKAEADRVHTNTVLFSTWARPRIACSQPRRFPGAGWLGVGSGASDLPNIQLLDGTQHPSPAGTYLVAAVLYRAVFNTSAIGSTYYGRLRKETGTNLQRIADQIPLQ